MKIEEKIVSDLAYDLKTKLKNQVISQLKKESTNLKKHENQCLENTWEEYCISVQEKNSLYLEKDYKKHILELFKKQFSALSIYEKTSIWIRTQEGVNWFYDKKELSSNLDDIPLDFDDCKDEFYRLVLEIAKTYDNDNIYRFIYMGCHSFVEDYSEDDKELVYE